MSRVVPTRGTKTLSFLFICLSALLIYIDITLVRASKTLKRTSHRPVASALTHATQNIASKPAREQERAARPTRRAGHAERDGTKRETENSGRPKEEVPKKIKARASAWRNKRNKNRKWRKYKDQSKR